jgi:hypothetical protein
MHLGSKIEPPHGSRMMRHFCGIVVIFFATSLSIAGEARSNITVGPNVRISAANSDRAHWETRIAADPGHAGSLLASSFIHSSKDDTLHTVVYKTHRFVLGRRT